MLHPCTSSSTALCRGEPGTPFGGPLHPLLHSPLPRESLEYPSLHLLLQPPAEESLGHPSLYPLLHSDMQRQSLRHPSLDPCATSSTAPCRGEPGAHLAAPLHLLFHSPTQRASLGHPYLQPSTPFFAAPCRREPRTRFAAPPSSQPHAERVWGTPHCTSSSTAPCRESLGHASLHPCTPSSQPHTDSKPGAPLLAPLHLFFRNPIQRASLGHPSVHPSTSSFTASCRREPRAPLPAPPSSHPSVQGEPGTLLLAPLHLFFHNRMQRASLGHPYLQPLHLLLCNLLPRESVGHPSLHPLPCLLHCPMQRESLGHHYLQPPAQVLAARLPSPLH